MLAKIGATTHGASTPKIDLSFENDVNNGLISVRSREIAGQAEIRSGLEACVATERSASKVGFTVNLLSKTNRATLQGATPLVERSRAAKPGAA